MKGKDDMPADAEVAHFLESVFSQYGYDLRAYARASMRRRVRAVMAKVGIDQVRDLERRVLADARFAIDVIDDMTVRVSEMFRDPKLFRTIRELLVPTLRTYPRLNIWNSGCATGEEAYSTAILLTEEGLYDRCQIYATDLSARALEQAKQGIYAATSLARFAQNYAVAGGTSVFSRYFTEAYGHIAMRDFLRRNILFFQHDLVCDHVFGEMHVILCRNVFIYFGPDLQERIAAKLIQSLRPGGFLGLGPVERVPAALRGHFAKVKADQRIYRYEPRPDAGPSRAQRS